MREHLDRVRLAPNALNALRLGLAASVLVAHCWPLGGFGLPPALGRQGLGEFAVCSFFAVSGYLITGSRLTLSLPRFAWHRFLRIYPAFLMALLVVAVVLGPASALLTDAPFDTASAISYVGSNLTMRSGQWFIAGTLPGVPFAPGGSAPWNGSLWTLIFELQCYLAVGLWLSIPAVRRLPACTWLALVLITEAGIFHLGGPSNYYLFMFGTYFAAGAALRVSDHVIPVTRHLALVAIVSAVVITATTDHVLAAVPLAYTLLWCSSSAPRRLKGWRQDYSYGVYVYAFPVQQIAALIGLHRFGLPVFLAASAVGVAPLAFASWWLVERPIGKLRHVPVPGLLTRRHTAPPLIPANLTSAEVS